LLSDIAILPRESLPSSRNNRYDADQPATRLAFAHRFGVKSDNGRYDFICPKMSWVCPF